MNEQVSVTTNKEQSDEALLAFQSYINKTVNFPVRIDFLTKCYCLKCKNSYDMKANKVKELMEMSPECFSHLPPGIKNLDTEENIRKCYFILKNGCFACSKDVKIITEVRLYPNKKNGHNSIIK